MPLHISLQLKRLNFLRKLLCSKIFFIFYFNIYNINLDLDPEPVLDPNWAKTLDPDPNAKFFLTIYFPINAMNIYTLYRVSIAIISSCHQSAVNRRSITFVYATYYIKTTFFLFFFFLSYSLWGLPTLACKPLCAKGNPLCAKNNPLCAKNNPLCANANAKYLDLQHCTLWIILSFNGTVARCVPDVGPR